MCLVFNGLSAAASRPAGSSQTVENKAEPFNAQ